MRLRNLPFLILILSNFFAGCAVAPMIARKPSQESLIDRNFIEKSIGKNFVYKRPTPPDGEPNCVAAALRAGGYTPAFAITGTDSFYENLLPICFSKKSDGDLPQAGDLGIIYENSVPTLAHMVLFLDQDAVFEKPGPQNDQPFRLNTWSAILNKEARSSADFQVWKYNPQSTCPLANLQRNFLYNEKYKELRNIGELIDSKIFDHNSNQAHQFNPERLKILLLRQEKTLKQFLKVKGSTFDFKSSYSELYETLYIMDLIKTLVRSQRQ